MFKKTLSTIGIIFIALLMVFNTVYAQGYKDIKGHWAKDYINPLTEKNIISGYPDGTFKPNNNITVAEFTKLILVSSGTKYKATKIWYESIISEAKKAGIIKEGEFDNYDKRLITRGEMARMIARQLGVNSPKVEKTSFKDDKKIPENLKGYIKAASDNEIITGLPNGNFNANGNATRGEATMIYRMISKLDDKDKKPISEVVSNSKELYEKNIKYIKTVPASAYTFDTYEKDGDKFIISDVVTYAMVFIKDGKIVKQVFPMPALDKVYYLIDFDLKDIEYLGIYTFRTDTMEILENPFK